MNLTLWRVHVLRRASSKLCAMIWLVFAAPSSAFYFLLEVEPLPLIAGQAGQLLVTTTCHNRIFIFSPQDRLISVEGNVVRVEALGAPGTVILCTFPTATRRLDLVPLAEGEYRIEFWRRTEPPNVRVDLMVSGNFVVGPAPIPPPPAHPIPAMDSTWLLGGLLALVALIGARRARG